MLLLKKLYQNTVLIPVPKKLKYQGFELAYVNAKNINQIIKSVNVNKAKGPDGISAKFAKISADIIDCHIANIISKDISENTYSENAKTANVRAIFKSPSRPDPGRREKIKIIFFFFWHFYVVPQKVLWRP